MIYKAFLSYRISFLYILNAIRSPFLAHLLPLSSLLCVRIEFLLLGLALRLGSANLGLTNLETTKLGPADLDPG